MSVVRLATDVSGGFGRRSSPDHPSPTSVDGTEITETEGPAICADRYKIDPAVRAARRGTNRSKALKKRTGRGKKESTEAAPAPGPSGTRRYRPQGGLTCPHPEPRTPSRNDSVTAPCPVCGEGRCHPRAGGGAARMLADRPVTVAVTSHPCWNSPPCQLANPAGPPPSTPAALVVPGPSVSSTAPTAGPSCTAPARRRLPLLLRTGRLPGTGLRLT